MNKINNSNYFVVFSGSNQRAVVSLIRFLSSNKIPFGIIANGKDDDIFLSDYSKFVISIREYNSLKIVEIIKLIKSNELIQKFSKIFILPTTEYLNRIFLDNRYILKNYDVFIPLCNKKTYHNISNKETFYKICLKNNISVPKELDVNKLSFPCYAKPKNYELSIRKPIRLKDKYDFESLSKVDKLSNYFFQESVEGRSIYLLVYIGLNGSISTYYQENFIQQPDGKSIILAKSIFLEDKEVVNSYVNLLIKLKFTGICMIELRGNNGNWKMIEANPRFWGPLQLVLDSGMELLDYFFYDLGSLSTVKKRIFKENIFYFWSGAYLNYKDILFNASIYSNVEDFYFQLKDKIISSDIYNRSDTFEIYKKEKYEY